MKKAKIVIIVALGFAVLSTLAFEDEVMSESTYCIQVQEKVTPNYKNLDCDN